MRAGEKWWRFQAGHTCHVHGPIMFAAKCKKNHRTGFRYFLFASPAATEGVIISLSNAHIATSAIKNACACSLGVRIGARERLIVSHEMWNVYI